MKSVILLFLSVSFLGCTSPREKWYNQMIDSLNRLDFPPRELDTIFFQEYSRCGIFLDTIYPNGIHQRIETNYTGNYFSYIRHKDSLICDILEYDIKDAKLLSWSKEYIHGERIDTYDVDYLKDGTVDDFFIWEYSEDNYIVPGYSIYQLLGKLRKEKLDLLNNSSIYYGKKEFYNPDSTLNHIKWCWRVRLRDTIGHPKLNVVERLYDGQTGEFIDSSRIYLKWRYDDLK